MERRQNIVRTKPARELHITRWWVVTEPAVADANSSACEAVTGISLPKCILSSSHHTWTSKAELRSATDVMCQAGGWRPIPLGMPRRR